MRKKTLPQFGLDEIYPDHISDLQRGYPDVQKKKPKGTSSKRPGEVQDHRICLTSLQPVATPQVRVIKKPPRKVVIATEPSNGSGPVGHVLKNGTLKIRTRRK